MTPYELLGVSPHATPDEVEAAYHRRLRACHPDLHWADGPDAVAEAEQQTRAITAAMAQLRTQWAQGPKFTAPPRPTAARPTAPHPDAGDTTDWPPRNQHETWSNFGYAPDGEHDWFGNPLDRKVRADHVDCPLCGQRYADPAAYRYHLAASHLIDDPSVGLSPNPASKEKRPGMEGKGVWLGWIPWPAFWFFVVLLVYWGLVIAVAPTVLLRAIGIWSGVLGYTLLIRLAFKHRRAR